ncbi:MAG: pentapeptide repeat-containing protein [Terracidiphilus sp.]
MRFDELDTANAASFLRRWASFVFLLAILVGLVAAVQIVPEWQVKRVGSESTSANPNWKMSVADVATLQNEMRKTFIQVVGGAFALFALYLTYRRVKVTEQGHITDRYTKAIEQLGAMTAENKPNIEVRLGAIYSLERIAIDSARDHWTIMEVLTAYLRQNAPAPKEQPSEEENVEAIASGPSTEIQAVLTVLGRRPRGGGRERNFYRVHRLDLRHSDFRGAHFEWAHLEGARFDDSHAEGAHFFHAYVRDARFGRTNIRRANFLGARAEGASFYRSDVREAHFDLAYLEGAMFDTANLEGTSFDGAHLEGTTFVRALGSSGDKSKSA